ncbi:MAG: phosphodiester glycosidase family protein [Bacilli bacterium]|nr:phosphodiester glycosidase family protein [Bacilli bacterium]
MKLINKYKKLIIIISSILLVFIGSGLFLLYGPYSGFRDFWITTAMTTMNHQYFATIFYSDETINEVLEKNSIIEPEGETDTNLIEIYDNTINKTVYKDEYDKQVLDHEEGVIYKYFKVEGYKFDAYMAVIYDPSKISVVKTKYIGVTGQYLVDMAKENNAIVAINGGGFVDINGASNGGEPRGIIIEDGKIIQSSRNRDKAGGVIGFTNDHKLFLGDVSAEKAIEAGVRDAVEFGPFLIVNGKSSFIKGNGGYGIHPRTAIGQRKDGIVLFLVVDGRRVDSVGAGMKDLTDIMLKYGAYNAANLDGGNSSVLVINNKIVNRPINWFDQEITRPIATGFIVTK